MFNWVVLKERTKNIGKTTVFGKMVDYPFKDNTRMAKTGEVPDTPSNLVECPSNSSATITEFQVLSPDITNLAPQDPGVIESVSPITQYDVGDILLGKVIREDLSNGEKVNYISHYFTPGEKFDLFKTQSIVRGKTQQKKVLVFQHSWLDRYRWLVYSISVGGGLCKFCILFSSETDKRKYCGMLVNRPFINFVKATGKVVFWNIINACNITKLPFRMV
ncbi:52 kDa repressor of the inhibitor of the protein kinase [Oopsacas minuta]|uniref:52 kDa repressor of the inhibitor of the protein kinase n=1 Tax=Oopsacas minuta TaxID=111878 RepID=A0AAV7JI08_9METZ|nr:52 kDa repressor of the inhibitor of the protein kinase [Oopsacas minuta]